MPRQKHCPTSKAFHQHIHNPTTDTLGFEEDRYHDLVHVDKLIMEEWIHFGKHRLQACFHLWGQLHCGRDLGSFFFAVT